MTFYPKNEKQSKKVHNETNFKHLKKKKVKRKLIPLFYSHFNVFA